MKDQAHTLQLQDSKTTDLSQSLNNANRRVAELESHQNTYLSQIESLKHEVRLLTQHEQSVQETNQRLVFQLQESSNAVE